MGNCNGPADYDSYVGCLENVTFDERAVLEVGMLNAALIGINEMDSALREGGADSEFQDVRNVTEV